MQNGAMLGTLQNLRNKFLGKIAWMTEIGGKIRVPYLKKKIAIEDVHAIMSLCQPGDILLSYNNGQLSNWFISGRYKHAAVVIDRFDVVEGVDPVATRTNMYEFCLKKDKLCLVRSKEIDGDENYKVASEAMKMIGLPYDYKFFIPNRDGRPNRKLYCSELAWLCHKKVYPDMEFKLRRFLGVRTVTPDDFRQAKKYWEVICEV